MVLNILNSIRRKNGRKLSKIPLSELLKMNPENPSLCENEYGKRQTVLELSQNINLNKLERWFLVQKKNVIPGFLYSKKEYYSLFEDKNTDIYGVVNH